MRLSPATLRSWVVGRNYTTHSGARRSRRLLQPATAEPITLSFWNLIEAHVLRALRTEHGVSAPDLRAALDYAESQLGIADLLLRKDLQTEGGRVLLSRYGELIDLSRSGQIAMRQVLHVHLKRVEWDETDFPIRLYPFLSADDTGTDRVVSIDPRIAFGRPVVRGAGVSTRVIVDRLDVGESVSDVAADYGLSERLIEQAVLYERAA
ncbi:MAG: DUF433 domain-containing protein [Candidatus Eisenbacteria bacterium]|nr:DUF433 domain-containing protein [Candidatus Eisenbacteria bacterium]